MAYVTAEQTRNLKKRLKQTFPNLKINVRNEHYSVAQITIAEGNIDFSDILEDYKYLQINGYYPDWYGKHSKIIKKILDIANEGNHDHSDHMTDYFDVGWYVRLDIGSWDKPYIYKA